MSKVKIQKAKEKIILLYFLIFTFDLIINILKNEIFY